MGFGPNAATGLLRIHKLSHVFSLLSLAGALKLSPKYAKTDHSYGKKSETSNIILI